MKSAWRSCLSEAELGPPSLDLGFSVTVMKNPAATFRPMSVLPLERVHRLQVVSCPFLIKSALFSNLGEKITPRTGVGERVKTAHSRVDKLWKRWVLRVRS